MELLIILVLGIYIAAAGWLAGWMLQPINRIAGQLQLSTRFVLTDVLGLMALLQVPLAVVGRAIDTGHDEDHSPYWLILGVAVLLVLVLWTAAVSVVSRAGITRVWRRLTVIVLLVPGALAVIMLWPLALIAMIATLAMGYDGAGRASLGFVGFPALIAATVVIRRLSFWVLQHSAGAASLATIHAP